MIKEAIKEVIEGKDLNANEARAVMDEIMSGQTTQSQTAAFLTALRIKGETIEEITALAEGMRAAGTTIKPDTEVMEIVGTGGDEVGTFNISTTSAFVVAAAGIPVAKHGNRSVSSKSGAADILESMGTKLDLDVDQNEKVLKDTGMCFLFAQKYHSAMRYVGPVRKELGVRTVFNILGPLTSPAAATRQVLGVYDESLVEPMAKALSNLGVKKGIAVYGNGLDELTVTGPNKIVEFCDGEFKSYVLNPEDVGLNTYSLDEIIGGTPEENVDITRGILNGTITGAKREMVLLNAGAAIYLYDKAESISDGVKKAAEIIDSGAALKKMEEFVAATNQF
ncbi:MAG: anthranilate phosphoribosyltransferase [Lachnospiraceae bacterium]|nr:anthranilate phosphoribosyltransferase [Lachnospiraceae bacterium]